MSADRSVTAHYFLEGFLTMAKPVPSVLSERRFLPELDGIRGFAVVIAVLYHVSPKIVHGGFIGIELFFVLSGYLITSLLWKEYQRSGRINLAAFYARRARRILPAATLVIVSVATFILFVFPTSKKPGFGSDLAASAAQVMNLKLYYDSSNYWLSQTAVSPFLHYWSLGVEEQYYLVWPLLLIGLITLARKFKMSQTRVLVSAMTTIVIVSLALATVWAYTDPMAAYYLMPSRMWEIVVGALLVFIVPARRYLSEYVTGVLGWLGCALILYSAFAFNSFLRWPGALALVPVVGAALAIFAGDAKQGPGRLLSVRPLRAMGRWSYSLYLIHWPALVLTSVVLQRPLTMSEGLLIVAATVPVAAFSFRYLESPFREGKWFRGSGRGLMLGAGLIALSMVSALLVSTRPVPDSHARPDMPLTVQAAQDALRAALRQDALPASIVPAVGTAARELLTTEPYISHCNLENGEPNTFRACTFGPVDAKTKVWLIGDSHAAAWHPAFATLADSLNFRLTTHTRSGCTLLNLNSALSNQTAGKYVECTSWRKSLLSTIAEAHPDILVITGSVTNTGDKPQELASLLKELKPLAGKVVALEDVPHRDVLPDDCLAWHAMTLTQCISSDDVAGEARYAATLTAIHEAGVTSIDVRPWFCLNGRCPFVVGNVSLYRDYDHMTREGALWASAQLRQAFAPLLPSSQLSR